MTLLQFEERFAIRNWSYASGTSEGVGIAMGECPTPLLRSCQEVWRQSPPDLVGHLTLSEIDAGYGSFPLESGSFHLIIPPLLRLSHNVRRH